jgi:hypothetical protein
LEFHDREFESLMIDVAFACGVMLNRHIGLGGAFALTSFPSGNVYDRVDGSNETVPLSPGGYIGPALFVFPGARAGPLRMDVILAFGGAGAHLKWGGAGYFVNVVPVVRLWSNARSHVGLYAKLLYAQFFWDGGTRPVLGIAAGPELSWY